MTDDMTLHNGLPSTDTNDSSPTSNGSLATADGGSKKNRRKQKAKFQRISKARQLANARERRRAQRIHDGFLALAKHVPHDNDEIGRLSRIEILYRAMSYIEQLKNMLGPDATAKLPAAAAAMVDSVHFHSANGVAVPRTDGDESFNLAEIDFDIDEDLSDIASTPDDDSRNTFEELESALSSLSRATSSHSLSTPSLPTSRPTCAFASHRSLANGRLYTPTNSPCSVDSEGQQQPCILRGISALVPSPQNTGRRDGTSYETPLRWSRKRQPDSPSADDFAAVTVAKAPRAYDDRLLFEQNSCGNFLPPSQQAPIDFDFDFDCFSSCKMTTTRWSGPASFLAPMSPTVFAGDSYGVC
eukprot:m.26425 g.26425  ORF g.26425 m.26425 type:complete len:357 (+) comp29322_c0_seq1:360-1430(+)